ncbi:DMT family transporter [Salinisphaera sp. SWV1]|uniref:DMT family transporter n=1 Tax=Salinisphaera sp. SWV1 TaxID=3454139 RepID=UPI003F8780C2
MLLVVAATWGSSYSATKLATYELPVLGFLVLRFGLTFLILLPALGPLFGAQWRRKLLIGCSLGINLFAVFLCETFGVTLTSAANAAFLISLCVGFTPLVERILFNKPIAKSIIVTVALSILGAALLSFNSKSNFSFGWGDGLMLLAAVLRAVMVCLTRRLAADHVLPALTLTVIQAGVIALGSIVLLCVGPAVGGDTLSQTIVNISNESIKFWMEIGYLVLFCTIFAFFAQNFAASRTNPTRVSLLMGSEPAFGGLFAVIWLGESVSFTGWIGGTLIVGATCVASVLKTR